MNINNMADDHVVLSFQKYLELQRNGSLYSANDDKPQDLIKLYYDTQDHISFDDIMSNFMQKYIYNENALENVHEKLERDGLIEVYNYIQSNKWYKLPNIYVILQIHILLFSKTPYPYFGGSFRNISAFISKSDVKTSEPERISRDVSELNNTYEELLNTGSELKTDIDNDKLFEYINDVIRLKCRLIEIHPFPDGNGRTMRSLVNILFKNVGLPPVYVKKGEKQEYIQAMDNAIRNKDYSSINKFYYYKICDSIIELDIAERLKNDTCKVYKKTLN